MFLKRESNGTLEENFIEALAVENEMLSIGVHHT